MMAKVHDTLTEALDSIKASGLIRRYALVWSGRGAAPRIIVWQAADASDDVVRNHLVHSLAGLAVESQQTIEKD
jgi:hypothetical protein